jgi:hypothetical protein
MQHFLDISLSFTVSIIVRETTLPWGTLTPDPETPPTGDDNDKPKQRQMIGGEKLLVKR